MNQETNLSIKPLNNQPTNSSANQPTNESIHQWVTVSFHQLVIHSVVHFICQLIIWLHHQSIHQPANRPIHICLLFARCLYDTGLHGGVIAQFVLGIYVAVEFTVNAVLYVLVWAKLRRVAAQLPPQLPTARVHDKLAKVSTVRQIRSHLLPRSL